MLRQFFAGLVMAVFFTGAGAQAAFPNQPIRLVVPYPPGGFTDILARIIGKQLTESLQQPVIVDNKGGGGSIIGTENVAQAKPDGYTLLLVAPDFAINESLAKKLPYNALSDFALISLAAYSPMVLAVNPSVPAKSVEELIKLAKAKPGTLNFASAGNGTGSHLTAEQFKNMAGIDIAHIPYKGMGPAATALIGGEVSVMFLQLAVAAPHAAAGKLRVLAMPGAERSAIMPDVPTLNETVLPGFSVSPWFGIVAPAGTPKPVVEKLNQAISHVMSLPEVKEQLAKQGAEAASSTPEEFAAFVKAEIPHWAEVVEKSGARID